MAETTCVAGPTLRTSEVITSDTCVVSGSRARPMTETSASRSVKMPTSLFSLSTTTAPIFSLFMIRTASATSIVGMTDTNREFFFSLSNMDTVSRLTMLLPSLSTYVRDHWSCHHDCNAGRMWGPTWRNTPTRLLGWNAASMRPAQHRVTYRTLRVLRLQAGHETWLQTQTGALLT